MQLQSLSALIIKDNYVRKIDLAVISCLQNLSYLNLYNNIIENFTVSQQPCRTQRPIIEKPNCSSELKLIFSYNKIGLTLYDFELVYPKASWLELQYNLVSSLHNEAFKNMNCLSHLDLRNNPLTFIKSNSFKTLLHLKTLLITSTSIIRLTTSFSFLQYFTTSPFLQLASSSSSYKDNLFDKLRILYYRAEYVFNIDLSDNQIPSVDHLEKGLKVFPNAASLVLQRCGIKFSNFSLPNRNLTLLDLSQNQIKEITSSVLKSVPQLKSLILSQNQITQFDIDLLELTPNIEKLDLSHNHIALLTTNKPSHLQLNNFKWLNLQNNYIFSLAEDIFSYTFLSNLEYLDLRWNSIECYCEMSQTFGQWLLQDSYKLESRPGFLP